MAIKNSCKFMLAGAVLLAAAGCCRTGGRPPSENSVRPVAQVGGELVYNLGHGVYANSDAVTLAGGLARPQAVRLAGGVAGCCPNPLPQVYLDALRDNRAPSVASARPGPAAGDSAAGSGTASREPGALSGAGYCAPAVCPVLPESQGLCRPGDNLSECFTLNEEEAAGTPIFVPNAETPLSFDRGALERVETASRDDALVPPRALAKAAPQTPPAEAPSVVPAPPSEAPSVPAPPAAPPGRSGGGDIMPPVPDAADFDAAIDAILGRDDEHNASASLPAVELPPKLQ